MSGEETEREEMKEETHDVEDIEQDELDEEDSEDEWSWIHERLIMRINNKMMQEEAQSKDNRKFSLKRSLLYVIGYIQAFSSLHMEWLQTQ